MDGMQLSLAASALLAAAAWTTTELRLHRSFVIVQHASCGGARIFSSWPAPTHKGVVLLAQHQHRLMHTTGMKVLLLLLAVLQVVNVDISPVVIEQMRLMDQLPGQTWEVADCRSMPQYEDACFGSVLDKGTLDAVLCSSHGTADAAAYINEVYRLLTPGGVFLLISLGQPQARLAALKAAPAMQSTTPLPYLSADLQQRAAASTAAAAAAVAATAGNISSSNSDSGKGESAQSWRWESVEVYLLPKPSLYLQSESSLTGKPIVAHMRHSDKDMPVEWLGPFKPGSELDAFIAQQHLDLREFFTAFACTKPTEGAEQSVEQQ